MLRWWQGCDARGWDVMFGVSVGRTAGVVPGTSVETHVRYGAFLRAVPPSRRVGDYAHAASRAVNAVFKRLLADAPVWGHRAAADLQLGPIFLRSVH